MQHEETMTLTIAPETETRLRTVAAGHGLAPEQALEVLLGRALTDAEAQRRETIAGLRQSAEEFAEGKWLTPDELDAQLRAR